METDTFCLFTNLLHIEDPFSRLSDNMDFYGSIIMDALHGVVHRRVTSNPNSAVIQIFRFYLKHAFRNITHIYYYKC